MQQTLEKLYQAQTLNQAESHQLFSAIITGQLEPTQLAAALIAMKVRGETPEEIAGAATALLEDARPFPRPDYTFADIVGTGGDGSNSINISTASALVAATCGLKVAKHGNRSVSSKSGSSDLLAAFGINLDMPADRARKALDDLNVCFLFAPQYHTGFRHAMPVRQQLKTRTLFNVLGPLINPARPPLAVIGVYSPELVMPIAQTLKVLGYQRAAVVHGGGMDEVALHDVTHVAELREGEITRYQLSPEDFGFGFHPKEALAGGTPEENRDILTALLQGNGQQAHEEAGGMDEVALHDVTHVAELREGEITRYQLSPEDFGFGFHPKEALAGGTPEENRDILTALLQGNGQQAHEEAVAVNVAMLLKVFGQEDLRENAQQALNAIRSGQAYERVVALAARG
ncbi:anthranilate phosphoribosyltransferase [Pantoea sp. M_5]|nr:anthranilate phosphoribosyltransferase [Pantoea sp. M_5]